MQLILKFQNLKFDYSIKQIFIKQTIVKIFLYKVIMLI